jgi:hypothetical protein
MKNRFELWQKALDDLSARCAASTARDVQTVAARIKHEGDAFFDITLPKFGKDFERALAHSAVVKGQFVGWKKANLDPEKSFISCVVKASSPILADSLSGERPFEGAIRRLYDPERGLFDDELQTVQLPDFLLGFTEQLFDVETGLLVQISGDENPDWEGSEAECRKADCVRAVRQLTLMFGKVEQECSPARNQAAVLSYLNTDREIEETLGRITSRPDFFNRDILPLKKVFLTLFGDVLTRLDKDVYENNLVPAHGPGSTADRLAGNQKFYQFEWTDRLEHILPYGEYAIPNWRHAYALDRVVWRSPSEERPVKVTLVPKDASKPRVIAQEPTCMQYAQQAIGRTLVPYLESDPRTSSFLGFTEQWPNQAMAQIGSIDGSLATLDLSEASDRVPNWLVEELLEFWPHVNEAVQSSRSLRADVPGVGIVPLAKYASMGSALTFPIEAMVFLTIVMSAITSKESKPGSWKAMKPLQDQVRVYGDDIIVPTTYADTVMRALEFYGFKVNSAKSFWTGGFRESCGKEYYRGYDVSIVKFRQMLPQSLQDVTEIISTVSTRNQLFQAGFEGLVEMLDDVLVEVLHGHYPYVTDTSSVLGRLSPSGLYEIQGIDEDLHAPFVRGYVQSAKSPINWLDGWHALLKCLLMDQGESISDSMTYRDFESWKQPPNTEEHLDRSGRPRAARIKLVNAKPF